MVQHHPEYVSLAWGTMKLVFSVVIEHERLGSTIVTALDSVGEALSRVELAESLYPTQQMRDTIVMLNCHVITFLCRALDWYRSSSFSRIVKAATRPAALRYDDLIGEISKALSQVSDLSQAGSQAEQRDMHSEMRQENLAQQDFRSIMQRRLDEVGHQLNTLAQQMYSKGDLKGIRQQMQDVTALVETISQRQTSSEQTLLQALLVTKQDIQATQAQIRTQISEVQLNQALSFILDRCAIDHRRAYESAFAQRRARRVAPSKCAPLWDSKHFHNWDRSSTHNTITLVSTHHEWRSVRDFYVGIIEQLMGSDVSVIWIIQQRGHGPQVDQKHSIFEVLRSLVAQTFKATFMKTDVGLSSQIRTFEAAQTIEEYTSLLVYNLSQIKLAYFLIDATAIQPESMDDCHKVLQKIPSLLREQKKDTVVKIMFMTLGLRSQGVTGAEHDQSAVVKVVQASKRKSKNVPRSPLRGSKTGRMPLR